MHKLKFIHIYFTEMYRLRRKTTQKLDDRQNFTVEATYLFRVDWILYSTFYLFNGTPKFDGNIF